MTPRNVAYGFVRHSLALKKTSYVLLEGSRKEVTLTLGSSQILKPDLFVKTLLTSLPVAIPTLSNP